MEVIWVTIIVINVLDWDSYLFIASVASLSLVKFFDRLSVIKVDFLDPFVLYHDKIVALPLIFESFD